MSTSRVSTLVAGILIVRHPTLVPAYFLGRDANVSFPSFEKRDSNER
jgi:hypothetical protein